MNGGLTYLEMEERKAAVGEVARLRAQVAALERANQILRGQEASSVQIRVHPGNDAAGSKAEQDVSGG